MLKPPIGNKKLKYIAGTSGHVLSFSRNSNVINYFTNARMAPNSLLENRSTTIKNQKSERCHPYLTLYFTFFVLKFLLRTTKVSSEIKLQRIRFYNNYYSADSLFQFFCKYDIQKVISACEMGRHGLFVSLKHRCSDVHSEQAQQGSKEHTCTSENLPNPHTQPS